MSENKTHGTKKRDEIINAFKAGDSLIRKHIRELMGYEEPYDEDIYYDPDLGKIDIEQNTGSWYENDNRIFLTIIKRGIADCHGGELMEISGVNGWNDFDDFTGNEDAQLYIDNLIDEEYARIESDVLDVLKEM